MTTQIKIQMAGHNVLVRTVDRYNNTKTVHEQIIRVGEEPPVHGLFCTTSRTIEIVDLEPDDPRLTEGLG